MADITGYLISDEKILQQWQDGSTNVYATNKRVILDRYNEIIDVSYPHISSIKFDRSTSIPKIVSGIFLLLFAIFSFMFLGFLEIGYIIGFFFILIALLLFVTSSSSKIKMYITGREPEVLSGNMESMLKWVRDYKTKIETSSAEVEDDRRIPKTKTETTPIETTPPTKVELLRSAMKALEKGDTALAQEFMKQATSLSGKNKKLAPKKREGKS